MEDEQNWIFKSHPYINYISCSLKRVSANGASTVYSRQLNEQMNEKMDKNMNECWMNKWLSTLAETKISIMSHQIM